MRRKKNHRMYLKAKHLAYSLHVCAGIYNINNQEEQKLVRIKPLLIRIRAYIFVGQLLLPGHLDYLWIPGNDNPWMLTVQKECLPLLSVVKEASGCFWWVPHEPPEAWWSCSSACLLTWEICIKCLLCVKTVLSCGTLRANTETEIQGPYKFAF